MKEAQDANLLSQESKCSKGSTHARANGGPVFPATFLGGGGVVVVFILSKFQN